MKNITIQQQIINSKIKLPTAPKPIGNYKAIVTVGNLAYFSGQLPLLNGLLMYQGKIGIDLSIKDGYEASKLCALNVLSQIKKFENYYHFEKIVKLDGYINCTENFTEHASVLDGASDLFASLLDNNGSHVRSVLGCSSLPLNSAVEIVVALEIQENKGKNI